MEYTCFRCANIIFILYFTICIKCVSAGRGMAQNVFVCADGKQCIPFLEQCNGNADCKDGSDEQNCTLLRRCKSTQDEFVCEDRRKCIPVLARCDGFPDCADKSDENNCIKGCKSTQDEFVCKNRRECIPVLARCDGVPDCADKSDENNCIKGCKSTKDDEFVCEDRRKCIPILARCDGFPDCADKSDENNCIRDSLCPFGKERCPDRSACITPSQKCDSVKDCSDGWDEHLQECFFDILQLFSEERQSTGIVYLTGPEDYPAFQVKHNASIDGQPVGKFFTNNTLNTTFSVTASLRLLSTEASLFSVVNPANINQFGVELAQTTRNLTNYTKVSIYYTPDARSKNSSTILAQFYIPDITNDWTDLGIKINDSTVEIYQDCILINSTSVVQRDQIVFDQDSFVYLASNGSNNSVSFVGELMELKVHKYPENAIHPHCPEYQVDDGSGLGNYTKVSGVHDCLKVYGIDKVYDTGVAGVQGIDAFTEEDNTDGKQIKQTEAKSTFQGAQENVEQDVNSNDNAHTLPNTDANISVTKKVDSKDQHIIHTQAQSTTVDLKFVSPSSYGQRVENKDNNHILPENNADNTLKSELHTREPRVTQDHAKAKVTGIDVYNALKTTVQSQVIPNRAEAKTFGSSSMQGYRETTRKQKFGDHHTLTTAETTDHEGPGSVEGDRELSITAVIIGSTTAVMVSVSLSVCVTIWLKTKFVNLKRLRKRESKSSISCGDILNIKQRRLSVEEGVECSNDQNIKRATESDVGHHPEQLDVDDENHDKKASKAISGGGDSFELINEHIVATEPSAADENPVIMTTFF